jgi:hypothetical protein
VHYCMLDMNATLCYAVQESEYKKELPPERQAWIATRERE